MARGGPKYRHEFLSRFGLSHIPVYWDRRAMLFNLQDRLIDEKGWAKSDATYYSVEIHSTFGGKRSLLAVEYQSGGFSLKGVDGGEEIHHQNFGTLEELVNYVFEWIDDAEW